MNWRSWVSRSALGRQLRTPGLGMGQGGLGLGQAGGHPVAQAVPGPPQAAPAGGQGRVGASQPALQEGLELGAMRAIVLRVDVPEKGLAGPLGAHKGILAAHAVEIAGPEQAVIVVLAQIGQGLPAQARGQGGRIRCGQRRLGRAGADQEQGGRFAQPGQQLAQARIGGRQRGSPGAPPVAGPCPAAPARPGRRSAAAPPAARARAAGRRCAC